MKKVLFVWMLMLASICGAQSYSAPRFTATFNGPVTTSNGVNDAKTSSYVIYGSSQGDVEEEVLVRNIYAGSIDVTLDSARFYRNELAKQQTLLTDISSEGYYEGHPYAYGNYKIAANGVDYFYFVRFIIVDQHTAVFISMSFPVQNSYAKTPAGAYQLWQDFENTLNIQ